jgi:hypothetical protein
MIRLMTLRTFGVVMLALGVAGSGFAGDHFLEEPLVTDRPDFTESSSTVGRGVLQLEGGVTFAEFEGGAEVTTLGEVLARWGVTSKLELRFVLPIYAWERNSGDDRSGFSDTAVGLKYELAQGAGSGLIGGMEAALIASTTVPTGGSDFGSSSWQPVGVLCLGWELSDSVGLGVNLGVARPTGDGERFTSTWASVALGVGLTDAASVFFELYGFNREDARGPNTLTFQTGVVYLLSPDLQLDARVARRLTDRGVDFLFGAGLSWRLGG